jgi:hypothetical protein
MSGLGRKTFAAGEVLRAAEVNDYLMDQAVMRFGGTAARGSAIGTAVSEGMVSYLDDLNQIQVYDGSAWQRVYPSVANIGEIVQVVSVTKTNIFTSTATSYTDIPDLSLSITPTSASNKILLMVDVGSFGNANAGVAQALTFVRNTTILNQPDTGGLRGNIQTYYNSTNSSSVSMNFLDSPATTSATTYKIQGASNGGTWIINRLAADASFTATSNLTAMEVVA